tara:strand:+ start:1828 stop:2853 length:1026 start_codon:yes stop_codon:yes gene_type:complete
MFNFQQVPLVGEHIAVLKGPSSMTNPGTMASSYFYLGPISIHGNNHLNPMPGSMDIEKAGGGGLGLATSVGAAAAGKFRYKPGDNFKEKKDVLKIQPYEGDLIIEGRNRQSIRLGSSMIGNTMQYAKQAFYKGKQNSPITILANGHKKGGPAAVAKVGIGRLAKSFSTPTYGLEDPDTTDSIFIMSSDHKISMKLAKTSKKYGEGVEKLSVYLKPQIIASSDRIILNAKKDEILLIAKKDVKIVTKGWNSDMDKFFDTMLDFMEEVIKQNTELEKLHKEVGAVSQANATSIHPTGVGPSGPPTNAGSFIKSKGKATAGASKTKTIRTAITKLKNVIKKMKG